MDTGDAVVVSPEISSGLPIQGVHRWPPPGSRPERYTTPATKGMSFAYLWLQGTDMYGRAASDIAQNPYWKRDVRRVYPRLSVVTQEGMAELLQIKGSEGKACVRYHICVSPSLMVFHSVAAPAETKDGEPVATVPAVTEAVELTSVIAASATPFSAGKLPPTLKTPYKRWIPQDAEDAPHDPNAYWPMVMVK